MKTIPDTRHARCAYKSFGQPPSFHLLRSSLLANHHNNQIQVIESQSQENIALLMLATVRRVDEINGNRLPSVSLSVGEQ